MSASRRDFLLTTGMAAGSLLVDVPDLFAQAPLQRRSAWTIPDADPIWVGYNRAVAAMKALPASDKRNWIFQANIHGSVTSSPFWNACQHSSWFFLPWHRMYLHFFERIVRRFSGVQNWTLPFWDYSPANFRALPRPFRTGSPYPQLANPNRRAGWNNGQNALAAATVSETSAMGPGATSFTAFGGVRITTPTMHDGGAGALEFTPHNGVHRALGGDMGDPVTAARDPIFWCHHSNIDRLWIKWLALGGTRRNPVNDAVWKQKLFTFWDENGTERKMSPCEVLVAAVQLNYVYAGGPAEPNVQCPATAGGREAVPSVRTIARRAGAQVKGAKPVTLSIAIPSREGAAPPLAGPGELVVQLENVADDPAHSVIYEVYVGLPSGTAPDPNGPFFVGSFALFESGAHAAHGGERGRNIPFTLAAALKQRLGEKAANVAITVVPRSAHVTAGREAAVPEASSLTIGGVSLNVRQ